jgi:hypothetical protein
MTIYYDRQCDRDTKSFLQELWFQWMETRLTERPTGMLCGV